MAKRAVEEVYRTKVNVANRKSSLKTTIPSEVVKRLNIEDGNVLEWAVVTQDGKPIAKIRRVRLVEASD